MGYCKNQNHDSVIENSNEIFNQVLNESIHIKEYTKKKTVENNIIEVQVSEIKIERRTSKPQDQSDFNSEDMQSKKKDSVFKDLLKENPISPNIKVNLKNGHQPKNLNRGITQSGKNYKSKKQNKINEKKENPLKVIAEPIEQDSKGFFAKEVELDDSSVMNEALEENSEDKVSSKKNTDQNNQIKSFKNIDQGFIEDDAVKKASQILDVLRVQSNQEMDLASMQQNSNNMLAYDVAVKAKNRNYNNNRNHHSEIMDDINMNKQKFYVPMGMQDQTKFKSQHQIKTIPKLDAKANVKANIIEAEEVISSDSESDDEDKEDKKNLKKVLKQNTSKSVPIKNKSSLSSQKKGPEIAVSKEIFFALRKRNIKDDYKLGTLIGQGMYTF